MSRRPPKPVTRMRLARQVAHYLKRWFTTRGHLRRLMIRKIDGALQHHPGDRDEAIGWLDAMLDDCEASGLLDDERFARDRTRLLLSRGASVRMIRAKLQSKLVPRELVDEVLAPLGTASDLRAAAAYVRKKRMGCWRDDPEAWRERDLGRLARAGFSYGIVKQVLEADAEELEALERHP